MIPSRLHRSLTVNSRRNPSSTIGIFSSGVYLRRVAVLTLRTKDLVSSVRSSAPTALVVAVWDIIAPLSEYSTSSRELSTPQTSRVFLPHFVSHYR